MDKDYVDDFINHTGALFGETRNHPSTLLQRDNSSRRPVAIIDNGELTEINISSTYIKKLLYKGEERPDICPSNIYFLDVKQEYKFEPTVSMLYGLYAETKLLGKSAYGMVMDLKRDSRTGRKTADHLRIDDMIDRIKLVFNRTKMIVTPSNTQIEKRISWQDPETDRTWPGIKIYLNIITDIISPYEDEKYSVFFDKPICIDFKLAKDRHECFINRYMPWVSFSWGCPEKMDHLQAILYSYVLDLPFMYLVGDYNPKNAEPGYKPIPIKTVSSMPDDIESRTRLRELFQSIRWTINKTVEMNEQGWPAIQGETCKKCPVISCNYKYNTKPI